jgi:chromosome segregation ATPase
MNTVESTVDELRREVEALDQKVESLARQVTEARMNAWETRVEQLQLEVALGRMELRDELAPRMERLRAALESGRRELSLVPGLVREAFTDASVDLGPVFQQLERAYTEAREAMS